MAKDPALLFYTSDFLTGTFTMTNEQVGMYIRLLCLQHQKGKLSEDDMKSVCGAYVERVYSKFARDGKFFVNAKLKDEADKRVKFCESRRQSALSVKKDSKAYAQRMENENENTNTIVINKESTIHEGTNWESIRTNFFNDFRWKEKICRDKGILPQALETQMDEFISNIELKEDFKDLKELKSHFINTFNKNKNGIKNNSGRANGAQQLTELIKQDYARRK